MAKVLSKEEWKRRKKMIAYIKLGGAAVLALVILLLVIGIGIKGIRYLRSGNAKTDAPTQTMKQQLDITEYFLSKNNYSRPARKLMNVKSIVIHYAADAASTAIQQRNRYESLKDGAQSADSCHFIIGLDGEIIQCIPLDEVACASGERNPDSISISFCHPLTDGQPNDETFEAMVRLVTYLCKQYNLSEKDVLRHSDLSQEVCPKYFAEQEAKWAAFRAEVGSLIKAD